MNTEEFIAKAKSIHGDKYDYSLVNYINKRTKVKLICPLHGEWDTLPNTIYRGSNCPKCAIETFKSTKENFITKAKLVHGDKYDYSKVDYVHAHSKVIIICPIHGEWEQKPNTHLNGHGCLHCAKQEAFLTLDEFIEKSNQVHKNKYNYSKVIYEHNKAKVTIVCPIHGEFEQAPKNHLRGKGCMECAKPLKVSFLSQDEFIDRSNKVHDNFFSYEKVIYKDSRLPVEILCPKHGPFFQAPRNHMEGYGCRKCRESSGEKTIRKYLIGNNINYIPQKTFDDCRGKRNKLPFDFYLPDYSLCIEFQGEQHYRPIKYWGGMEKFLMIQETDTIKRNYCAKNGIGYLSIPYTEDPIKLLASTLQVSIQ